MNRFIQLMLLTIFKNIRRDELLWILRIPNGDYHVQRNSQQHWDIFYSIYYLANVCENTLRYMSTYGIATYCTAWRRTALHGDVLHCMAKYCTVRRRTALHGDVLHCTATCCIARRRTALHGDVLHCMATYCTARRRTALSGDVWHCMATYCTARRRTALQGDVQHCTARCTIQYMATRQSIYHCLEPRTKHYIK